jgi:Ca2+-transporting ATPase
MTHWAVPMARLGTLLTTDRGLTRTEVEERRQRYGANDILETPPRPWWDLVRDTAGDPMIWFLAGVGALYGVVGEIGEALTVVVAIIPLVAMDAFLHHRTRASTEGLKSRLADRATVVREGAPTVIPATEVVPGDLIVVSPGESFPADGLVVRGADLQADESMLTGEAYAVAKRALSGRPRGVEEPLVATEHWAFAGTRLLTGQATLRIAFTGGETLYGQIVRSAVRGARARTPLQQAIQRLVSALLVAASAVCLLLAVVRLRQGYGWVDALVSAVTLAAAALPEEFPVVFTFFLGVGVYRLARRQALVRRAVAVENIGRVTVICSDKTGTITEGRLHLTHRLPADDVLDHRLLALAAAASRDDSGDPMDAAILAEADAAGVLRERPQVLATFPFTEARRRETAVTREQDGTAVAATKGAAEVIMATATLTSVERERWSERVTALAAEGHKVIACAWRPVDGLVWRGDEPAHGYRLAGLLAFEDPVRDGVAEAIQACREAGIHPIMVTGDHPLTARSVARQIGLGGQSPHVISGDALEEMAAGSGRDELRRTDVIARAVPGQKLTLVRLLQEMGEIVAVTGDGVNDVPALRAADVGVAMGERGTRSAREVAAIVLLDDNFQTIVGAMREGRQLFRNLQLSFQYVLMVHVPFVASALLIPLAGYPLLYFPVHIVWVELIIHPTALLVFQESADGSLERAPARAVSRFFSLREWGLIAVVGGLLAVLVGGAYVWSAAEPPGIAHGRAMALATLTLGSGVLTALLSGLRTWAARLVVAGTVAVSVVLIQTPALAQLLHLAPLHLRDWGLALGGSVLAALPLALNLTTRLIRRHLDTDSDMAPTLSRARRETER